MGGWVPGQVWGGSGSSRGLPRERARLGDGLGPQGQVGEFGRVWGSGESPSHPIATVCPLGCTPSPGTPWQTWHTCAAPPVQLQARLRAELQGAQGPPGPGDVGRLPLLQATVSETLRLRPPAPLALPHCALRHTRYQGRAGPVWGRRWEERPPASLGEGQPPQNRKGPPGIISRVQENPAEPIRPQRVPLRPIRSQYGPGKTPVRPEYAEYLPVNPRRAQ